MSIPEPWSAMGVPELVDRLEAISAYHAADPQFVKPFCVACGNAWPCLTQKMAAQSYRLEDGTE